MNGHTFHQNAVLDIIKAPGALATEVVPATWIDMSGWSRIVFFALAGATMDADDTIDFQVRQATSAAGAGAKDITGATITALAGADDGKVRSCEVRAEKLDVSGGFRFVALSVTVAGASAPVGALAAIRYRGGPLAPTQPATYDEQVFV